MEKRSLYDFLELVLESEFSGISWKHKISTTSKGYNFHCPFCGDTQSIRKKPRANIYTSSNTFKCFNAGCMTWIPLRKFITIMARKHDIEILDLDFDFTDSHEFSGFAKSDIKLNKNNTILDYLEDIDVLPVLPTIDYIADRFSLKRLNQVASGSSVMNFLKQRNVHELPGAYDFIFADGLDDKIYIFNYEKTTGKVVSFSTRKTEYKAYKIYTFSDILTATGINIEIKDLPLVNSIGNYYNILNIDFNKPVKITEGQLDSMFLFNSAAVQGISKVNFIHDYIDKEKIFTFFDRDEAGVGASITDIKHGYNVFMWSLLISKLKKKYYNDIAKIIKIKDVNNLYSFLYKKTKLDIQQFNDLTDRYYTNNIYDIFNL